MKDQERQQAMAEGFKALAAQKEITPEEMQSYIVEVLEKVFSKDRGYDYTNEEMELGDVKATFDINTGDISIVRKWEVVKEIDPNKALRQVQEGTEEAEGLKAGDVKEENIILSEQPVNKIQQIKQLLIQKTREAEKEKIYDKFSEHDGTLVTAKVMRVEEKYYILDYENTSIFLHRSETLPTDRFTERELIKVYISSVDKVAKDAQVVASRTHPKFVKALIEEEVDDVADGVIEVVNITRLPGFKTKVAVRSNLPEVDPVGAIIGVRGTRIRTLMDLINGERIDVIKYDDNIHNYIAAALTPAEIKGVKFWEAPAEDDETKILKYATVVVEEDQFLSALGKAGKNVKLAVKLTGVRIDVKTVAEAAEEGIEYTETKSNYEPRKEEFQEIFDEEFTQEFDMLDQIANVESDEDIDYSQYTEEALEIKEEDEARENEFTTNEDAEEIDIMNDKSLEEEDYEEEDDLFDDSYDEFDEE